MVDKIIKFSAFEMPPKVDFIENKIKEAKIDPVRWAIVEINDSEITLSVCGFKI